MATIDQEFAGYLAGRRLGQIIADTVSAIETRTPPEQLPEILGLLADALDAAATALRLRADQHQGPEPPTT